MERPSLVGRCAHFTEPSARRRYHRYMCGRFVQLPLFTAAQAPWPDLADDLQNITAKYNLAPTQRAAVVMEDDGNLAVRKLRWGLIPPWQADLHSKFSTINARVETVSTLKSFRSAWKAPRRCLVPMAGWYEWRDQDEGGKPVKQPYYIHAADQQTLWAAGIWEPRRDFQPEDEAGSLSIVTMDAPERFDLHDRVPIFLEPALANEFMAASPDDAMAMLLAAPFPDLTVYPVSRKVNSSRKNFGGPEFIVRTDG